MARHSDSRLRLVRVESGYARASTQVALGAYENECRCGGGPDECSWARQLAKGAGRGYKARRGSWATTDGRFALSWIASCGVATKTHPSGCLRMWDSLLVLESWFASIRDARAEMLRRYERAAVEGQL